MDIKVAPVESMTELFWLANSVQVPMTKYNLVVLGQLIFLVSFIYQVIEWKVIKNIFYLLMQVDCNSITVKNSGDLNGEIFRNLEIKLQSKVIEKRSAKSKDGRIRLLKINHHPKILIEYEYEI